MSHSSFNRRGFLRSAAGATVAVSAAALAGSLPAAASQGGGRLVPQNQIGIQLYSVRDNVSQLGFRAVFEELSRIGYREIEFAGYTQSTSILGRQITVPEIAQLLKDFGLKAVGSHVGLNNFRTNLQGELDNAEILGLKHIGTANAPTNVNTVDGYRAAAEEFNTFGAAARDRGLKFYQHNHAGEFAFATDQPKVRLYDVFLEHTDPRLVYLEMDVYWAYVGQYRFPGFDPADYITRAPHRYPLLHLKDGDENPANPNGYDIVEFGAGDLPYRRFLKRVNGRGRYHGIWEQDTAPNTQPNPPGSFAAALRSYQALTDLRG
ncbi:sugar phosphate isomerase/epimerase family protein [Amycolatopsis tucumanensis]|uniref:Sugar phosphate isomerase/epimerase n=1 Tax=Amycolatopsis tucumanensis TaxID=401106 RepID=A0ABP7J326_9PSEU|nr:sugar phosphate isomerase/epimerase [Amycolatopsis tucumanensis]MCF6425328.1 sugar phosphate isomerase/epimerase [Amycolatopsis tucumanensis]